MRVPQLRHPGVLVASVGTLLAALLLLGPVLAHPTTRVLGAWDSEAAWHIWRHAAWLRTFAEQGPWVRAREPGLIDPDQANLFPATTLLAWPAWWAAGGGLAGVALSWNVVYALSFACAVGGTWVFVRAWLPEDRSGMAAAFAVLVVAFGAFLHQTPTVGRLETLQQLLWPMHLAFLYRACVRPRRWYDLLLAAESFGLLTMQGGFPALFCGIVEVPVALWCLYGAPRRAFALGVLVCVAAVGTAALWPWVEANRLYPPASLAVGRAGTISVPLLQLLPGGGHVPFLRGYHEAPYPGTVVLLAALGVALRVRAARFWVACGLGVIALMVGPDARWTADGPLLATMPVAWLSALPGWSVPATGWARLGTFVPPILAFAVAPALVNRPRAAAVLALLAVLDQLAWRPPWQAPERSWDLSLPEGLAARSGPSIWLPMDERALTWLHTAGPDERRFPVNERLSLPTLRWVDHALRGTPDGFRRHDLSNEAAAPSAGCIARDAGLLAEAGFERIVLLHDHGDATEVERTLREALGAPVAETDRGQAWALRFADRAVCDTATGELPAGDHPARGKPVHPHGGGRPR